MTFIKASDVNIIRQDSVKPGSLLFSCAHYDYPPAFIFDFKGKSHAFELQKRSGSSGGFNPTRVNENSNHYLVAPIYQIEIDVSQKSRVSPTRSDYIPGDVVIIRDQTAFTVRPTSGGTFHVSTEGQVIDIDKLRDAVGFRHWRITIPSAEKEPFVVYENDSEV